MAWRSTPNPVCPDCSRGDCPRSSGRVSSGRTETGAGRVEEWSQARVDDEFHAIVSDLALAPTELIDPASGQVAGVASRTVWGQTRWSGASTPLRFAGQQYDEETGLHYNRYRYYNPETATYTSPDPLGVGPNPASATAYVHNPHTWVDPLGLKGCGGLFKNAVNKIHDGSLRVGYNRRAKAIGRAGMRDMKNGADPESVARRVVQQRNDLKQSVRDRMWDRGAVQKLEARNLEKYQNPIGPTFEYLRDTKGASPADIIGSSGRTAKWISVFKILGQK